MAVENPAVAVAAPRNPIAREPIATAPPSVPPFATALSPMAISASPACGADGAIAKSTPLLACI